MRLFGFVFVGVLICGGGPAAAAPIFQWSFDQPTGIVGPLDTFGMAITVTNTGPVATPFYISNIHGGDMAPFGFELFQDMPSFMANVDGRTLAPNESVQMNFGTQVPSPGSVAPGVYQVTQAHLIFCTDNQNQSCSIRIAPRNGFQRTVVASNAVPEPMSGALVGVSLLLLAGGLRAMQGRN